MKRGAEINCSDPGWDQTAAVSMLTLMCRPVSPNLPWRQAHGLAQVLAKRGKLQGPQHACGVGSLGTGSCLT